MAPSRILVVADHAIVRRGIREVLASETDLEVCGEAADVSQAIEEFDRTKPDLVIIDLTLRGGHGMDLIEKIKARGETAKMLVYSMHDEMLFAERVLRAGAMGYLTKQEPTETLVAAVRQVLRGEVWLSSKMTSRLGHQVVGEALPAESPLQSLSNREIEVFEMIGQGLTTMQIARRLELSPKTIETHREKIRQKLNLKNSAEVSRRAVQWALDRG